MQSMKSAGMTALVALATLLGTQAAMARDFQANIFFPDKHPLGKYGYVEWAEKLSELSDGELEAQVFTGTVLLPPRSGLSGVRDGIVSVGYHAATYTPAELPISNAIQELGFNYTDPLVMAVASTEFNMTNPAALKQWADVDVVFGGGYSTPAYNLMCNAPMRSIADLKGKRLRTAGAAMSQWAENIGAVPVNVPSSDMYSGIEKGLLDCAVNVANDLKSRSLWDVAKHTTMVSLGLYWVGPMWAYNQEFWNELTPEERSIFFKANAYSIADLYIGYENEIEAALAEAKDHGVTIYGSEGDITLSIRKFAGEYLPEVYKKAREKYNLEDPEAILGEFDATVKKWEKLLADVDRKDVNAIAAVISTNLYDKIDVTSYGVN